MFARTEIPSNPCVYHSVDLNWITGCVALQAGRKIRKYCNTFLSVGRKKEIPKKRRSGGKTGSSKGSYNNVQCSKCGRMVPRSKAKAVTRRTSLVDGRMYAELKKTGTIIQTPSTKKYYCISCAVHSHQVSQRSKASRKF